MREKYGTSFAYIEYFVPDDIYIDALYVEPEYRSRGFATKLMEQFITYCKNESYNTIYLMASTELGSDLERLIKFYERLGFVQSHQFSYSGMYANMYIDLTKIESNTIIETLEY